MGDEESKTGKRGRSYITAESIATLLQRYTENQVLRLLEEVELSATEKIDWNEIVKTTTTGISSAGEYRMLWRHLACGHALTDQFDDPNPPDDDSDEVVSKESAAEASASVKAIIASGLPVGSNEPNNRLFEVTVLSEFEVQEENIIGAVPVQQETFSSGTSGADDSPRKSRKRWSEEEELKLTAAVDENGEDWDNIAAQDFNNERTPYALSLRWAAIRKKKGILPKRISRQDADAKRASVKALGLIVGTGPNATNPEAAPPMNNIGTETTQHEQIASAPPSDPQLGMAGPLKSQVLTERPPITCNSSPTSMIKDAAVAAGAHISNPAGASSLIEAAARSQKLVDPISEAAVSGSDNISPATEVDPISENQSSSIGNQSKQEVDSASGNTLGLGGNTQGDEASISSSRLLNQTSSEVEDDGEKQGDTITTGKEIQDDSTATARDETNA